MFFRPIHDNTHMQAHINQLSICWKLCCEHVLLKYKKMKEAIKMQSTGKKQQLRWKNDMVDDLISRKVVENFKTLIELKARMTVKHNTLEELCKEYEGFGQEELLKITNGTDQMI